MDILKLKAERSLIKYKLDAVVANELTTRYSKVFFLDQDGFKNLELIKEPSPTGCLEELIVGEVDRLYAERTPVETGIRLNLRM